MSRYWRTRLCNSFVNVAQPRLTTKLVSHSPYIKVVMETIHGSEGVAEDESVTPIELGRNT
jgi:hypothetical protein